MRSHVRASESRSTVAQPSRGDAAVAQVPASFAAPFDVTDADAVATGVAAVGEIDILVNKAGIQLRRSLEQFSPEEWRRVLDHNVTSAFLVSLASNASDFVNGHILYVGGGLLAVL